MNIAQILRSFLSEPEKPKETTLEWASKIAAVIPLGIGIGVVWQAVMLAKYQTLSFFSWNQAVNDAIVLSVPLLSGYAWWYFSKIDDRDFSPGYCWLFLRFVGVTLSAAIFTPVFIWILGMAIPSINSWLIGTILVFAWCGHVLQSGHIITQKWNEDIKPIANATIRNGIRPAIFILALILICSLMSSFYPTLYGTIYGNFYALRGNDRFSVKYMNDRYIIYEMGRAIPNDGSLKFEKEFP